MSNDHLTAAVDHDELYRHIAEMYRAVARGYTGELHFSIGRPLAESLGYPTDLLDRLPAEAADSFAGVGYHLGLAGLQPGERVLDLGSGSGTDAFAAGELVGPGGSVEGVDVTPEQLAKADRLRAGRPVTFRRAHIESLPYGEAAFDAVISNGVVNLSADKAAVFAEAARVLRPGGRLALSDIVTERPIAARTTGQADLWAACIAGAGQVDDYLDLVTTAGLELRAVNANPQYHFASERARRTAQTYGAQSISLLAVKPERTR
jgi:arsenite methyltransferase